jgi:hypothetical protein
MLTSFIDDRKPKKSNIAQYFAQQNGLQHG